MATSKRGKIVRGDLNIDIIQEKVEPLKKTKQKQPLTLVNDSGEPVMYLCSISQVESLTQ